MRSSLLLLTGVTLFLGCSAGSHVIAEENDTSTDDSPDDDETTRDDTEDEPDLVIDAGDNTDTPPLPSEPECTKASDSEEDCGDGIDDDCDGYTDCRDNECAGKTCGEGDLTCSAGACLMTAPALPELPPIENVRVIMNTDTARVEFEPIDAALDYRIYPLPNDDDILVGEDGELVINNAIYRCAGDRPFTRRQDDPGGFFDASTTAMVHDYQRTEEEAILGYAYTIPGPDRSPVYRMANPDGAGGYAWDYVTPPSSEYNSADYVVGEDERDRLIAMGYRDDGIAFYAPTDGTRPVYRLEYEDGDMGSHSTIFFNDGPEHDAHADDSDGVADMGERFRLLDEPADGAVPVYRVYYLMTNAFDVLAAGEARYQRALNQGNLPVWSLTWPGLTEPTTLVLEALDQGCPFPNGYISYESAPGNPDTDGHYPSITLDQARLESGEAYVNGQHDPANRPKPIARAFVDVSPEPAPEMDWYESFDVGGNWAEFDQFDTFNNGIYLRRNDDWVIEFSGCGEGNTVGPVLGQLVFGGGDYGSSCNMSIVPRAVEPEIKSDSYVHLRMTTEIPSTHRRYPQIMLTTTPLANVGELNENDVPVRHRLGPLPFEEDYVAHSGSEHTIVVQPFSSAHEMQIEFCDGRGWGVSVQCPRANIYGFHVGSYEDEWDAPWVPMPVLGDMVGHDRPVRFDVYASTKRVYVTLDGKPAGCAVLPEGRMPEGRITPIFGSVIYHGGIDEAVTEESSPHQYLRKYSLVHYDRKIDDLGIELDAEPPAWDESLLPCGTRWYGADE